MNALIPLPQSLITTRLATMDDLGFIDALQKKNSRQLGFFPRAQMEGYIKNEWVRVAMDEGGRAIGYCASRDRYLKRDELGVVFQLCVDETSQRKLIGASLLQSVFENSAYGTRLYCCWCAQDLAANKFWEACGFVPLAFRTGSRSKGKSSSPRVHIFWQKRIREGDDATPWWFPSQTNSGAIREDRIVLPIPFDTHWNEVMPMVLPGQERAGGGQLKEKKARQPKSKRPVLPEPPPSVFTLAKKDKPALVRRMSFAPSPAKPTATAVEVLPLAGEPAQKKQRTRGPKAKNDPKLIAFARELRDRWVEQIGDQPLLANGKYDVARALPEAQTTRSESHLLEAHVVKQLAA